MGFLDSLGSILGDIGTQIAEPFKNVTGLDIGTGGVKWRTPNPNLGDIASLASMFATPGFKVTSLADISNLGKHIGTSNFGLGSVFGAAGLKDPSKWNIGDVMKVAGMAQGMGQSGGGQFAAQPTGFNAMRMNDIMGARQALSPANQQGAATQYAAQAKRKARTEGRAEGSRLMAQGYGSAARGGALTSALNRANEEAGRFRMGMADPRAIAQNRLMQANLLSPQNVYAYDLFNAQMQQIGNQIAAGRPPSTVENVLGVLQNLDPRAAQEIQNLVAQMFGRPRQVNNAPAPEENVE